jgi:hypothetical protein
MEVQVPSAKMAEMSPYINLKVTGQLYRMHLKDSNSLSTTSSVQEQVVEEVRRKLLLETMHLKFMILGACFTRIHWIPRVLVRWMLQKFDVHPIVNVTTQETSH